MRSPLQFPSDLAGAAEDAAKLPGDLKDNPMLSAWLRINADKTVTLMIGKVELGQGAVTAVAQVCADELAVDLEPAQDHLRRHGPGSERRRYRRFAVDAELRARRSSWLQPRSGKFCSASPLPNSDNRSTE